MTTNNKSKNSGRSKPSNRKKTQTSTKTKSKRQQTKERAIPKPSSLITSYFRKADANNRLAVNNPLADRVDVGLANANPLANAVANTVLNDYAREEVADEGNIIEPILDEFDDTTPSMEKRKVSLSPNVFKTPCASMPKQVERYDSDSDDDDDMEAIDLKTGLSGRGSGEAELGFFRTDSKRAKTIRGRESDDLFNRIVVENNGPVDIDTETETAESNNEAVVVHSFIPVDERSEYVLHFVYVYILSFIISER